MNRFDKQTVIVTGGGGGIGGATFDIDLEAAEKVAAAIRADGGQTQAFRAEITDRDSVDLAVAATEAQMGPIDVLVNNAGWEVFTPFTRTSAAQWDKLIAIKLTGAPHMHHAVLPGMPERKNGHIVIIASDAGRVVPPPARCLGPAGVGGRRSRGPSAASVRATTSPTTSSAPARPTPRCSPTTGQVLGVSGGLTMNG